MTLIRMLFSFTLLIVFVMRVTVKIEQLKTLLLIMLEMIYHCFSFLELEVARDVEEKADLGSVKNQKS